MRNRTTQRPNKNIVEHPMKVDNTPGGVLASLWRSVMHCLSLDKKVFMITESYMSKHKASNSTHKIKANKAQLMSDIVAKDMTVKKLFFLLEDVLEADSVTLKLEVKVDGKTIGGDKTVVFKKGKENDKEKG